MFLCAAECFKEEPVLTDLGAVELVVTVPTPEVLVERAGAAVDAVSDTTGLELPPGL